MDQNTNIFQHQSQSEKESPSYTLFLLITELPLRNYIDGTVNGNLSAIIKSGVCADENTLYAAWEDMRGQYAEAIGDADQKLYLSLFKEINRLSIKIEQVNILVRTLQKYYAEPFARELNKVLSVNFQFNPENREQYFKNLSRCLTRCKNFQVVMQLKIDQFEAISKKEKTGQVADHAYYQSILVTLSQFMRYEVHDTVSVFQFCEMIKRLNHALEKQEKK